MRAVRLGDLVAGCRQEWLPHPAGADELVYLVEPSFIDPRMHAIRPLPMRAGQLPARPLQLLRGGDIVLSKVRPERGIVAIVPPDLDGALASTAVCTLRPLADRVCSDYLFHWVRSPLFWQQVSDRAPPGAYPTLSFAALREFSVPLPDSLAEQKEVVHRLDRVDTLALMRQAAGAVGERLDGALLSHLSGVLGGVPHRRLADLAELRAGISGEEGTSEAAVVMPGNLKRGWLDWTTTRWAAVNPEEKRGFCRDGDILFARNAAGYAEGRLAVFAADAVAAAGIDPSRVVVSPLIVQIRPHGVLPYYLESYLRTPQAHARQEPASRGQSVLSVGQLAELTVPVPAAYVQQQVQEARLCLLAIGRLQEQAERLLARLYDAVAARAFRGE